MRKLMQFIVAIVFMSFVALALYVLVQIGT